jgi:predicted membrane channel-forming protein YqfA (hemolysin III family)
MTKKPKMPSRPQTYAEEWANSLSHGIGLLAALIATPNVDLAALMYRVARLETGQVCAG